MRYNSKVKSEEISSSLRYYKDMDDIKQEVKAINRHEKINSILEDKEFKEMKLEDHPEYGIASLPEYLVKSFLESTWFLGYR